MAKKKQKREQKKKNKAATKTATKAVCLPFQNTGVGFYRVLQPAVFAKRMGLVDESLSSPFAGDGENLQYEFSDQWWINLLKDAKYVHSTVVVSQDLLLKLMNLRKMIGFKLFYDMDDNLYSVSADNPGARMVEKLKYNFETCMKLCDGLTVSVPNLKQVYSHLHDNIIVNPNFVDPLLYKRELKPHKGIRIGWRGAFGHKEDLEMIKPVIEAIKKEHKIKFVTLGWNPGWSDEHHEWVNLTQFPKKLADLKLDLALIPLIDSAYNRCKSNLAFLEYSALGIPTVTSKVENQIGCGINCRSNWEWYEAIIKLIKTKPIVPFVDTNRTRDLYKWMEQSKRRNF
jgi:hypothetical protein